MRTRETALHDGLLGKVIGGWDVSSIVTTRTGMPLAFTGNGAIINAPSNTETPNLIAPLQVLHGINTGNQWFSIASFAEPLTNT